jgi:hypothetical protein
MRLINADDISYEEHYVPYGDEMWQYQKELCVIKPIIDAMPTADPVKHAHWIDIYGGKYANPRYACSRCGGKALWGNVQDELLSWHEVQVFSDFCPHCGARMDGEDDG